VLVGADRTLPFNLRLALPCYVYFFLVLYEVAMVKRLQFIGVALCSLVIETSAQKREIFEGVSANATYDYVGMLIPVYNFSLRCLKNTT
jgi:hypothetical protein